VKIQKDANVEHLTRAPEAVRDVLWNGVTGKDRDLTSSWEMTEKFPRHIESTAQMVAQ
jgi:hypothetical protein